jgi:hypothetical protein
VGICGAQRRQAPPLSHGQRPIYSRAEHPSFEQREAAGGIVEIGKYPPNAAGIYNLSAGIREWINDWYDAKYYQTSPHRILLALKPARSTLFVATSAAIVQP